MRSHHSAPGTESAGAPTVITHSTILILGGILIGMGAADMAPAQSRSAIYLAGSFGVVAWFGLAHVAHRRRRQAADRDARVAASRIENRVGRHLASVSRAGRRTRIHAIEVPASQHLPVVVRSRGPRPAAGVRAGRAR